MASHSSNDLLPAQYVSEPDFIQIRDVVMNLSYYKDIVDVNVVGWFYWIDHVIFHELLKNVQKDITGDIAELGTANGKSAIAISNYKRQSDNLYLFDISQEFAESANTNIIHYGTPHNIHWHVQDSYSMTSDDIKVNKLRFMHIDGAHEHTPVLKDILNFSQHVADNGVMVLDDFNDPEYIGVQSAVIHFLLENQKWVMFANGQNKAYLCKREFYNFYALSLLDQLEKIKSGCGLNFSFNLREVIDCNVVLFNSRGAQTAQFCRENLNKKLSYTST